MSSKATDAARRQGQIDEADFILRFVLAERDQATAAADECAPGSLARYAALDKAHAYGIVAAYVQGSLSYLRDGGK